MNCSSVRNRPMPSAPDSASCGRSTSRPAFICSLIRLPSRVTGSTSRSARNCSWRRARKPYLFLVGPLQIGHRPQMHLGVVAIDDDRVAIFGQRHHARCLADHRNAHGARDDHHMAGHRAVFEHQAAHVFARIIEQLGRPHGARDDDRIVRENPSPTSCAP